MPVMPGAEPFTHAGGTHRRPALPRIHRQPAVAAAVGRVPGRGRAERLRCRGCPATARRGRTWRGPGGRTGTPRSTGPSMSSGRRSDEIFVMGLSMGGCLALRLAELRGPAVSGLVLVNPSVTADTRLFMLAPVLKLVVPSLKGIAQRHQEGGRQRGRLRPRSRSRPRTACGACGGSPRPARRRDRSRCSCTTAPPTTWSGRPASGCCAARCRAAAGGPGMPGQLPRCNPRQRRAGHLRREPGVRQDAQPRRGGIAAAPGERER